MTVIGTREKNLLMVSCLPSDGMGMGDWGFRFWEPLTQKELEIGYQNCGRCEQEVVEKQTIYAAKQIPRTRMASTAELMAA
jgi:hypothetical protein